MAPTDSIYSVMSSVVKVSVEVVNSQNRLVAPRYVDITIPHSAKTNNATSCILFNELTNTGNHTACEVESFIVILGLFDFFFLYKDC